MRGAPRFRAAGAALALLGAALGPLGACAAPADLILHGGPVYTLDSTRPVVGAVAVRGGRVLAVGELAELSRHRGAGTEMVDLGGRPLYPAFADAHLHLTGIGLARMRVDLTGTASEQEVVQRAAAAAAALPAGAWLQGRGWDQNDWPVQEFPTHHSLSAALPDRPAVLARVDGHAVLANAAAMRAAGLSAQTPDPPGGRILRDAAGAPTGVFVDAAEGLILRAVPPETAAELEQALRLAQEELHRNGIVAVHDTGAGEREIRLYQDLARSGALQLRVHAMLHGSDGALLEEWFARGPEPDYEGLGVLAVRAIKLYADGALGSRGALLLEDYADEPGHRGLTQTPRARLDEVCAAAQRAGFQVCTHAIGDAGNRLVLDAYAAARAPEGRWRIEHAQVLHPDDVRRFSELGVIPSMQAQHQTSDMPWAEARLGAERVRGAYAWRWLLDAGCIIPGGSDAPVESLDPIAAFAAAVTRSTLAGEPPGGWHPEQRMTREEALRHLTLWPAAAAFRERDLGRIAPGCRADFVQLSADLMTLPASRLREAQVTRTWFDGRQVYPVRESAGAPR